MWSLECSVFVLDAKFFIGLMDVKYCLAVVPSDSVCVCVCVRVQFRGSVGKIRVLQSRVSNISPKSENFPGGHRKRLVRCLGNVRSRAVGLMLRIFIYFLLFFLDYFFIGIGSCYPD